jgi:uncharacterized protein
MSQVPSESPAVPPAESQSPSSPPNAGAKQEVLGPRVDSLDLLRGVAILGIFLMNTQSMLLPQTAYTNPSVYGDFQGREFWAYVFTNTFADMKFITIFSFLFGAGIMLQGERVASRGMSAVGIHYKRMIILLIFGMIHAFGIWYGDILTTYACCGLLFFPLKRLPAGWLVAVGLVLILVEIPLAVAVMRGNIQFFPLQQISRYHYDLTSGMSDYAETIAYTGTWAEEFRYRARMAWDGQTYTFVFWTLWRCGGCILVGMGLHRWRFFHGTWGEPAYKALAIFGCGLGWTLTALGITNNADVQWDNNYLWKFGLDFNYIGSLLASLGYMAIGVLVAQRAARVDGWKVVTTLLHKGLVPIRAVGKMALTNYIFQSVVGTTLAYAHIISPDLRLGFGWFAEVTRTQLFPIVLVTWAVQMALSTLWLMHFRQGPLEWLWHKLVYLGKPYPVRPQETGLSAPSPVVIAETPTTANR